MRKYLLPAIICLMTLGKPRGLNSAPLVPDVARARFATCAVCVSDYSASYDQWAVSFGAACDDITRLDCSACPQGWDDCVNEADVADYDVCASYCDLQTRPPVAELERAIARDEVSTIKRILDEAPGFYVNFDRRAIQGVGCDGQSGTVNIPLNGELFRQLLSEQDDRTRLATDLFVEPVTSSRQWFGRCRDRRGAVRKSGLAGLHAGPQEAGSGRCAYRVRIK